MQSGFRSWRNGGKRRMEESRGMERQRVSVCVQGGLHEPENKQASDYDMNVNLNVYQWRVCLSRSEADHSTVPNHLRYRLWELLQQLAHPEAATFSSTPCPCQALLSFITVYTWVRNSFDSFWMTKLFCWLDRKPGLWFEACFCLYHSLKQGNIGMNKVDRQQRQSEATAWMLGSFEWNNPSMITVRHLRGSGLWRYVSLDTKKIYAHVEGEVRHKKILSAGCWYTRVSGGAP